MRVVLYRGTGVGPCVLAACCVLSLGRAGADDRAPSGSCPCGDRSRGNVNTLAPAAGPHVVAPGTGPIAPLPPVLPPPGTLGMTYGRQSWPIPAHKHPRIAMLDVHAPPTAMRVRVLTTYEYREEDELEGYRDPVNPCVWHFESKPLIPGIPHIYKVVSEEPFGEDWRMVRLIRGRRVTVDFGRRVAGAPAVDLHN